MGNYGNAIHDEWAPESIFQHSRADLDNIETARRIYKRKVQLKGGPMIAVCASPKSNSVCGFGAQQRKMVRRRRLRIIMIRTRGITLLIRNKFIPPPSMVFGWFKNFVCSDSIERMPPYPVHHLLCGIPFLVVNCDILFPYLYIFGAPVQNCVANEIEITLLGMTTTRHTQTKTDENGDDLQHGRMTMIIKDDTGELHSYTAAVAGCQNGIA